MTHASSTPDPYAVLGLDKTADLAAAKAAFRRLAKSCHPDACPGDAAAAEQFQRIRGALEAIERRLAAGAARAQFFDVYADARQRHARTARPGANRRARITVSLEEAITGTDRRIEIARGAVVAVRLPAGLEHGCILRVRGKGEPGRDGGPAGDALIEVMVKPHALFRLQGADVHLLHKALPRQMARGEEIVAPTPYGAVRVRLPIGARPGQVLRVRGKGLPPRAGRPAGDLYVTLRVGDTCEPMAAATSHAA